MSAARDAVAAIAITTQMMAAVYRQKRFTIAPIGEVLEG
jgi:hypothetical protein